MSDSEEKAGSPVKADNNSVALGSLQVDGSVGGDLTIAHTIGYTSDQVAALIAQFGTTFQPKPFDGRCPYKGLDSFEEEDAGLFFGREKLVEDLVSRVKGSRAVFVTGPSGSGKSSLVRAGLIHALRAGILRESQSERWLYATIKPGREPIQAVGRAAAKMAMSTNAEDEVCNKATTDPTIFARWCEIALQEGRDKRALLFIDQFEESFTQINLEEERVAFFNLLTHAATIENGRVIILFSMRSDFVPNCAAYSELNSLLNRQFIQIGAMQKDELVSAIAQPALRVGLRIDPDLIAQIINDMKGEPGALPLMQFALKDLFDSQSGKGSLIALTLHDYFARGGIHKALERHADQTFAELDAGEQELVRSIFAGLIEVGRGTQDTRRTAHLKELIPAGVHEQDVEMVLYKLTSARLITTDQTTVTLAHEKLIEAWPWLKNLVNENRESIALQNEIAEHARQWEWQGREASYLYTGARLAVARERLETRKLTLSGLAQDFVDAGIQMEANKQQAEERRRQKELEDAHKLTEFAQAQARAERRGRLVTIGMLVAALLLVGKLSYDPIRRGILKQKAMPPNIAVIEAGNYFLGDEQAASFPDEYLPYQKYVIPAFSIDVDPITNERYLYCIQAGVCSKPNSMRSDYEPDELGANPVIHVTALDAADFCNWLDMRLPTDKEWETAASTNKIRLPAFQPDTLEVFFEWTRSSYIQTEPDWTNILEDPLDALTKKGGALNQPLAEITTYRQGTDSTRSSSNTGFRCVKDH